MTMSESLVTRLMNLFLHNSHILHTDNYYSSLKLAQHLLSCKTYLCRTVRPHRKGLPHVVTKAKLERGEIKGLQNEDTIKVFNWKDKRNMLTLSSLPGHDDLLVETERRSRGGTDVQKPKRVIDYNIAKKGVDMSDQMSSYYSSLRKTKRWYKKVAIKLITGTTAVNVDI